MDEFEKIVKRFERLVYTVCYRMMGNEEDAKDITQEVFLKLYQNKEALKLENEKAAAGWLCRVANNRCIDELRKSKSRTNIISIDKSIETGEGILKSGINDGSKTPEQAYIQKESMEKLEEAILSLSPEHRAAIVLRDVQGYSYEEVADITKTTMGTVKSRVFRARENLKKILRKGTEQNDT